MQTPGTGTFALLQGAAQVPTQVEEAHSTTTQSVSPAQAQDTEANIENDKRAVYRHPLFPLMALLFEKCEQATYTPDCPSSDSFDVDIQAFVHHQEQDRKPFFSEDPDLDALMVKAIQVLRIHLLELEKVSELCKDFCNRYTSCLKGKLQSDNILRNEVPDMEPGNPTQMSSQLGGVSGVSGVGNSPTVVTSVAGNNVVIQSNSTVSPAMGALQPGQIVSGGTVYQMVQTPQGLVAQPIQIQQPVQSTPPAGNPVIHGSTPLSQIGLSSTASGSQSQSGESFTVLSQPPPVSSPLDDFDDDDMGKRKSKRGVLPKQATQVMKSWLFQHIVHPYPTEDEKRQIAAQTNLTLLQVNNWFINARRRILQPMLDAANPEGVKSKKAKPHTRPVQRFWPESIANLQSQVEKQNSLSQDMTSPNASSPESHCSGQQVLSEREEEGEQSPNLPQPQQILLPPGVAVALPDGGFLPAGSSGSRYISVMPTTCLSGAISTAQVTGMFTGSQQVATPTTVVMQNGEPHVDRVQTDTESVITDSRTQLAGRQTATFKLENAESASLLA